MFNVHFAQGEHRRALETSETLSLQVKARNVSERNNGSRIGTKRQRAGRTGRV